MVIETGAVGEFCDVDTATGTAVHDLPCCTAAGACAKFRGQPVGHGKLPRASRGPSDGPTMLQLRTLGARGW